jgi:hypothetical protein
MTPPEFVERYGAGLEEKGVYEGTERERVEQARQVWGLGEGDAVCGVHKVHFFLVFFPSILFCVHNDLVSRLRLAVVVPLDIRAASRRPRPCEV